MWDNPRNKQNVPMNHQAVAQLDEDRALKFLFDHLKNANYQKNGKAVRSTNDLVCSSNEDFWRPIIESPQPALRWVRLVHFQVTNWFPRTPGLYHTEQALSSRREARNYVFEENGVYMYDPYGKGHMLDGGIGSVRFKPVSINGEECWLSTATADGICHTGLPLAIPTRIMEYYDFNFDSSYQITGKVTFLPEFLDRHFYHWHRIPQVYISVHTIKKSGREKSGDVEITPMVFFTGAGDSPDERFSRGVTFVRCVANSTADLERASSWLSKYVDRYGGTIVTNYDQQRPTFQDAPFSLQKVMAGRLDEYSLSQYNINQAQIVCDTIQAIHTESVNMSKISVTLGDGTFIHGDFIVATSISNSFNKANSADISEDLKDLLKELSRQTGIISEQLPEEIASEAARDLEALTAEVTSKKPRKQSWELSLNGLKNAAKTAGEIGKPILEIAAKLVPLLTGIS